MTPFTRPFRPAFVLLLAFVLVGTAAGISLGTDWKQSPLLADNTYSGVSMTPDGGKVFSGGSQLIVRSWDGSFRWGGQAGFIAAMSADGNYVVTGSGNTVTLLNVSGTQLWSRNMDGQIRAVAVSPNGSYVISADDKGNYNSWGPMGDFYGRNQSDMAKRVAVSPSGDLVVAATERGLRYYSPVLSPLWTDDRQGSLDDYIVISSDGSTIITAGGTRLSSHTRAGILNWQTDAAGADINDIACNEDCSLIVIGSQDNTAKGIDRYGKTHWTYSSTQWVNAVGVSRSGSIVAVGANDGTLAVLDHGGNLLAQQKLNGRIQPRSVGISRDGSRIAVADQYNLYGLSLLGLGTGNIGSDTTFVAASLNPVQKTTAATPTPAAPTVTVTITEETLLPVTATTKASPVCIWLVLPALAGAVWLAGRNRRK